MKTFLSFEAMAYLCQTSSLEYHFGTEVSDAIQGRLREIGLSEKYTWFHRLGESLGLQELRKPRDGVVKVFSDNMFPLCFAALCSEIVPIDQYKLSGSGIPVDRFLALYKFFRDKKMNFKSMNIYQTYLITNWSVKQLFGRDILETLVADYEREEKNLDIISRKMGSSKPGIQAFSEFHDLRGRMLSEFKNDPLLYVDPSRFVLELSDKIKPRIIILSPDGSTQPPVQGHSPIFEDDLEWHNNERIRWWWASCESDWTKVDNLFSLCKREEWLEIFKFWGPFIKLMSDGRKGNNWFGPELMMAEEVLKQSGINIIFDPLFEYPTEISQESLKHWYIGSDKTVFCDLTGDEIPVEDSYIISGLSIRLKEKYYRFFSSHFIKTNIHELQFKKDLSVWVIKKSLLDKFE